MDANQEQCGWVRFGSFRRMLQNQQTRGSRTERISRGPLKTKLLELLRQETDEQHPLSTSQICNKLGEMGISCERRTLTKDITVLNELGYEVMWNWVGKEKGYYIEDRSFSVPELKILIDAVQAASFVTEKKTAELIDKIAALGGSHKADILKRNMVCFNTR